MSRTGRAVPLSLPLDSQNLRVLRSLRQNADTLQTRLQALEKLQSQLHELASKPQWEAIVPVQGALGLAYGSSSSGSRIVQTDKVTVNLGGGDEGGEEAGSGYWVEYTPEQAQGVALRKAEQLQARLGKIKTAIADAETSLSKEMGFEGGGVNQNYEVVNEEGLPFVDIQEFEDDDGVPQPLAESTLKSVEVPKASIADMLAASSQYTKPRLAMQMPTLPQEEEAKSVIQSAAPKASSASAIKVQESTSKKVSFTSETKAESTTDDSLPVIGSTSALAPPAVGSSSKSTPLTRNIPTSQDAGGPMKGMIIEKDTTKAPPSLTAAERSARLKSPLSEAQTFDGIVSHRGKSVDMSAYLPRSMRGVGGAARTDKGKGRAVEEATEVQGEEEDDIESEEEDEDDDSDGLYQYDDSEDEDNENYHIDDVLAMREAALLYHSKRYDLGAGIGTGPLGGNKRPDEYDELGRLTAADKGGLPFVETFETTDGERPASKFRTGRLQTARMFIPDLGSEAIDISKNVVAGDDLGPYESKDDAKDAAQGDHDFTGMSKEEIETFLRYVKALETGEDIDIIPAERKEEKAQTEPEPAPPVVKASQVPSVKTSIVEKTSVGQDAAVSKVQPSAEQAAEISEDKPKRVSRFRAARAGG